MITFTEISHPEEAVSFVKQNLSFIGEPLSVKHERNKETMFYETTIVGKKNSIFLKGGVSSGYKGTGTSAFIEVLKMLNVDQEETEKYVEGNRNDKHSFTIQLDENNN